MRIHLASASAIAAALLILTGCSSTKRSISDSGPKSHGGSYHYTDVDPQAFDYQGELSEFDLLGVNRDEFVTEGAIAATLEQAGTVRLRHGQKILLIQSGAVFPDDKMVEALSEQFVVVPFSGVPTERMQQSANNSDQPAYSRTFRMAAAQAGAEHIICYWGTLESVRSDMTTKTVSWIPLAGWVVPDENQAMRIQLKMAIIDVRTGNWTTVASRSLIDKNSRSNRFNRDRVDQKQVMELKDLAYQDGAEEIFERMMNDTL